MRLLEYFVFAAVIAAVLTGCADSSDSAASHSSQPGTRGRRILADDAYVRASSLASTPQERSAVATARGAEGPRTHWKPTRGSVTEMRLVLAESQVPEVRATVAAGLGNAVDIDSTPALLDAMEDESLLVRNASARAIEWMFGWRNDLRADDSIDKWREVVANYREKWTNFRGSELYKIATHPEAKEEVKRLAERKAKAEKRRERHPRNRKQEEHNPNQ